MGRDTRAQIEIDPVLELAQWLESLRQRAGFTYPQLAQKTGYSRVTFWRIGRGTSLPGRTVVEAFARVCGGDPVVARRKWTAAAQQRSLGTGMTDCQRPVLQPCFIQSPAELLHAMRVMKLEAGLSLRDLERKSMSSDGMVTLLPHSSVGAVLRGERMPSKGLTLNLIEACGVSRAPLRAWEDAWERAHHYLRWATGKAQDLEGALAA